MGAADFAAWGVALGALVLATFAAHGDGRLWARRAVALLLLYLIALTLAGWLLPPERAVWSSAAAAFAVLLAAQPFIALGLTTTVTAAYAALIASAATMTSIKSPMQSLFISFLLLFLW